MKDLFKVIFLLMLENDFDFVKREWNIILIFLEKENYLWDYVYVKYFCGVGKFYVRFNICKNVILDIFFDDSDSIFLFVMLFFFLGFFINDRFKLFNKYVMICCCGWLSIINVFRCVVYGWKCFFFSCFVFWD